VHEAQSFAETTIIEAVARLVRVDLVLEPITAHTDTRLISRFIGLRDEGIVLAVPHTQKDEKVFVPDGWELGLAFELGPLWLQARTVVLAHCQHMFRSDKRVDALVIQRPDKLVSANRRREKRETAQGDHPVTVTLWPADKALSAGAIRGRLLDQSETGLGLELAARLKVEEGAEVLVRLHVRNARECPILRGTVRRSRATAEGFWIVGLGDIVEIAPGEATALLGGSQD
jgi:hypothetical protein